MTASRLPNSAAANALHVLQRETFQTSRLLDFCSERELVKQIGHGTDLWPLVVLKELIDNALDDAEEAGTAPVIRIEVTDRAIIITDNGSGIPAETVAGILDFSVRVHPAKPMPPRPRGAQGNALKTILAMAFALDGTKGETLIESSGHRAPDQLQGRPCSARAEDRPCPRALFCKERHPDHGAMAGLCLLKTRRGEAAIFTNGRGLRLAKPAPYALRHLERPALHRLQGVRSGLAEMAPVRSDFAALVRRSAFAAADGCLYRPRSGSRP